MPTFMQASFMAAAPDTADRNPLDSVVFGASAMKSRSLKISCWKWLYLRARQPR
jgi:hypothetical protein